jgi:hypothetical protein
MPNEFDFKNYKTMEDYSKSLEGNKYFHDLYLKAVNHPIRREILIIVNNYIRISKSDLVKKLTDDNIIDDNYVFDYNMDYLVKAFCIQSIKDEKTKEIFYEITQGGKVVDYLK